MGLLLFLEAKHVYLGTKFKATLLSLAFYPKIRIIKSSYCLTLGGKLRDWVGLFQA